MGESKATISRRITRLETALGTALLRRSPRTIEMTDEGTTYRARVAEVLELLGDANAAAQGSRAVPSGQLRVTAPPGVGEILAPVLAQFSAAFPRVVVSIHIEARYVDIEAERFDVALRATTKLADSSLVAHRVKTAARDSIVVAAPSYLEAQPALRRVEDLASHRILVAQTREAAATLVAFRLQESDEPVVVRLPVALASTDIVLVRDMVVEGAGVSILPRILVQRYVEDGRLLHLLPGLVAPGLDLYLLHRAGRLVSPKIRAFIDFVKRGLELFPHKAARNSTPRRRRD
jgi:DNA-binding transcriptional LysR family regulator